MGEIDQINQIMMVLYVQLQITKNT